MALFQKFYLTIANTDLLLIRKTLMMNELNDDGMDARQRKVFVKKVIFSYGIDILLSVLLFIPAILGPWTKPYERPFSPTDPKISLPFDHSEIFPAWSLPVFILFFSYK